MVALLCFFLTLLASPFKPKSRLEADNAALRHRLAVLQRKVRGRVQFTNSDRLFFIQLYRWFPSILNAITIIRPETVVRWHRAGFRRYWRWKSRCMGGRPQIDAGLRALIRRMSVENRLWGAPHIHGELLKLGFEVAQSTVAKYMAKGRDPSSQGWGTFLRNHAPHIATMDLFVVPTIGFNLPWRAFGAEDLACRTAHCQPARWHRDIEEPRAESCRSACRPASPRGRKTVCTLHLSQCRLRGLRIAPGAPRR
jgi:hypothetical protein